MAMQRMQEEMKQKEANTKRFSTFVFKTAILVAEVKASAATSNANHYH